MMREWWQRVRGTLRQGRRDHDLEAELRSHLELAAEDARRRGHSSRDAERAARLRAGGTFQAVEALRNQRGLPWIGDLARDVRYGLRMLRRSPAFTTTALLTLALGIGANAAIYRLLDAVRLRALPVANPQELTILELADLSGWNGRRTSGYPVLTNRLWEAFRERQNLFSGVLAWSSVVFQHGDAAGSRSARGLFVSGGFFDVLGVEPLLGRVFTPADDRTGCGVPGAVVSHGFWQHQLGGDRMAVGRTIRLDARSVQVIGVTPPHFTGPEVGRSYDVAVPICAHESLGREAGWLKDDSVWWLTVMARRAPHRPLDSVNAELEAMSAGLFEATLPANQTSEDARAYRGLRLRAVPGGTGVSALRRRYGDPLVILLATTAAVLLVACSNLATLILARCSAREREFAVRLAIGASRGRLVRQVMIENGLLAVGGAAAGLALSGIFSRSLVGLLDDGLSLVLPLDAPAIAFVAALAFATCLTFGLIPVWRASRVAAHDAMKASARTLAGSRSGIGLRQALVISQVGLSLVLVFGAFLFAGTLRNLLAVDPGFRPDNVAIARIDFSRVQVPQDSRGTFTRAVLERVRSAPGVTAAAEVRHVPLGGTGSSLTVWRQGAGPPAKTTVRLNAMSEGYLRTMDTRLIAGRDFSPGDTARSPRVAIVNHSFVRRLGIDGNPVGQRFNADGAPAGVEIVGLVQDTKYFSLREDSLPIAFVPIAQIDDPRRFTDILIRSAASPDTLSATVRHLVTDLNPAIVAELRPFDSTIRDGLQRERLMAVLSGFFGALAAVIAAIGLYGVISYLVVRRTNEIGVRLALGARPTDILTMILRQTGILLAAGLGMGATLVLVLAGYVRSLVFGLEPHDPGALALACVLLGAVAFGAAVLPARRAAQLEPVAALRRE